MNLRTIPAFDLNAACSGWLYAVAMAQGMILSGMARNVLTVGVDMQSRLVDKSDRSTCFLFGDGAGAAIVSAGAAGHRIRRVMLGSDTRGLHMARRDGAGLFRPPTATAASTPGSASTGRRCSAWPPRASPPWCAQAICAEPAGQPEETRWVIPHQANGRILKAAAKRSGVAFDRFYLNVERVGNTSSASIPLAIDRDRRGPQAGRQAGPLRRRRRHDHGGRVRRVVKGTGTAGPADASLTWRTSSHRPKARLHPRTFPARPRAKTISLPHLRGLDTARPCRGS